MKRILSIIVLALTMTGAYAQRITEQQAMQRAIQYMTSKKTQEGASMFAPARGSSLKLESVPVETDGIYAFNMDGSGFVIASADARTLPVLGYSTTGSIDWEDMPENMRSWLQNCQEAIATLGDLTDYADGNSLNDAGTDRNWSAVEALIKTQWNQDEPYWDKCPPFNGANPDLNGKQCYTGCAATAIAQVMKYYQWPKMLPDGLPSYPNQSVYNGRTKIWNIDALPPVTFDWDNMLDSYMQRNSQTNKNEQVGTEIQRAAVATLMRYCGQALNILYGTAEMGGSSASSIGMINGLVKNLDYKAATFLTREDYSSIYEWEKTIYQELEEGRPVIYVGNSDMGGHAFVCDGYDGNGLFHINWGWGGYGDGYYSLSVMNPYNNISPGSGKSGIGFSIRQCAIIYTDPNMEARPDPTPREQHGPYSNRRLVIQNVTKVRNVYVYTGDKPLIVDNALGTIGPEGELTPVYLSDYKDSVLHNTSVYPYNEFHFNIDSTAYQAGQSVKLYPMVRVRKPGEQWQIIPPTYAYLYVGRDNEGHFFCQAQDDIDHDWIISGGSVTAGTGRLDERSDITVFFTNNDTVDYIKEVNLVPYYYGHIGSQDTDNLPVVYKGNKMTCQAYIPAKNQGEITFSFIPEYGGTVLFKFVDNGLTLGSFKLELNNDTLLNYNNYLENNSWFSREGNEWFYNVEICDRPRASMSYWIPSDNIRLTIRLFKDDEKVTQVILEDEIKEYLKDLPDKGGKGNYKFKYRIPVELDEDGVYFMDSYLKGPSVNGKSEISCIHEHKFNYSNPTSVKRTTAAQTDKPFYNLEGYPLKGIPERKGIYIKDGKKIYIE